MTIMEDQLAEKRKSPRIDFRLDIQVKGQDGLRDVRNLGLYGIFIRTENPAQFQIGDSIYIEMKFPHETKALSMKARVSHISKKGIGVEFMDLPPQDAMSMESCFNIFKHSTPMPGT
ncbi:MAG: PilZ domain-containing protein [Deltaproteobacteria bacterium]|nr:PilZ domain-containing protein [Deltaproteobacteria bacterium]